MSALSRLITKVTKRQLTIAKTVDEFSAITDRIIKFAEAENPYISDDEIDSLLPYIPVTEHEPEPEIETEGDGDVAQDGGESAE